jgi:co-chaperonin GroES (HSP10)
MKIAYTDLRPTPERVIVKITKEQRRRMFEKEFVRNDGTKGVLITGIRKDRGEHGASEQFINLGEVIAVGSRVKNIKAGDMAVLDYLVSNDDTIKVLEDEQAEYYSVRGVTTYEPQDVIMDVNRQRQFTMYLCRKGEIKEVSQIVAVIRDSQIIAIDPYVILSFAPYETTKQTASGIIFKQKRDVLRHEIVAVSEITKEKYGLEKGMKVAVEYAHCFSIDLPEPYGKLVGVNDQDVLIEDSLFLAEL